MRGEIKGFFIIKQIKKPRLCSVLLQSTQEAARARKKCRGKHETGNACYAGYFAPVAMQWPYKGDKKEVYERPTPTLPKQFLLDLGGQRIFF